MFWGGVVRSYDGHFVFDFYSLVGVSDVLHAKIMALLHELELFWTHGIRKVACYSDSVHTISLVHNPTSLHHLYNNELEVIKATMRRN